MTRYAFMVYITCRRVVFVQPCTSRVIAFRSLCYCNVCVGCRRVLWLLLLLFSTNRPDHSAISLSRRLAQYAVVSGHLCPLRMTFWLCHELVPDRGQVASEWSRSRTASPAIAKKHRNRKKAHDWKQFSLPRRFAMWFFLTMHDSEKKNFWIDKRPRVMLCHVFWYVFFFLIIIAITVWLWLDWVKKKKSRNSWYDYCLLRPPTYLFVLHYYDRALLSYWFGLSQSITQTH